MESSLHLNVIYPETSHIVFASSYWMLNLSVNTSESILLSAIGCFFFCPKTLHNVINCHLLYLVA